MFIFYKIKFWDIAELNCVLDYLNYRKEIITIILILKTE